LEKRRREKKIKAILPAKLTPTRLAGKRQIYKKHALKAYFLLLKLPYPQNFALLTFGFKYATMVAPLAKGVLLWKKQ